MEDSYYSYIKVFLDWLDAIEPLSDAERGRLFTSLLEYARTGEAGHLNGNERFIFPMMRAQIDRDYNAWKNSKDEISDARRKAGRMGGLASASKRKQSQAKGSKPKQTQANQAYEKEKDKEEEKDVAYIPPCSPPLCGSAELQAAFDRWLDYKREKRQAYKPQGLKALRSQVEKNAALYGVDAVIALIDECMASNWQGIIFDRLRERSREKTEDWSWETI